MNDHNAIVIDHLTVRFGDFTAVDDVSFSVNAGEIFGFLGANGAGKTTTIRVLCGLLVPSAGAVRVGGADLRAGAAAIKRQVGYMSQKFTLYDDLTVDENLAFKAALRGMDEETLRRRSASLFALMRFTHPRDTMVRALPGGAKQQVSLCAALLHEPPIVFLDEPTAGVSPRERAAFWDIIRALAAQGTTVIVTTHYMDEAEQCGRIALMREGKIIALDTPADLKISAYPDPILEVSGARADDIVLLQRLPGVGECRPFGARYHLSTLPGAYHDVRGSIPPHLAVREIRASLEDVFIRLIEGGGR